MRCGCPARSGEVGKQGFAASPGESVLVPWLESTLFPHLPQTSLRTVRIGLIGGVVVVAALAAAGLFPFALVVAASLVPALLILYLYDVDLYEDQSPTVVGLTVVWGLVAGACFGLVDLLVSPSGAGLSVQAGDEQLLLRGFVFPLVGTALVLAGPLVLLPYRRFNDVLDGVTFGAASAVTFVGSQAVVASWSVFREGVRPTGETLPWIFRVLEHGIALPVLAAGAAAGACGSLWLRYRAPARDRRALGLLGHPAVALTLAGAAAVLGSLAQLLLTRFVGLVALAALDVLALVWLRRVIHVGLMQESSEVDVAPDVTCANCGETTPLHSFCVSCGINRLALPKRRRRESEEGPVGAATAAPDSLFGRGTASAAFGPGRLLALCAGLLVVAAGLTTAGVAWANGPGPEALCSEEELCGPESASPLVDPETWSSSLGFRFEYDRSRWRVVKEGVASVTLQGGFGQVVSIRARRQATPAELLDERLGQLERRFPDLEAQDDPARVILGPSIGYRDGIGATYCGTISASQGWNARVDVVLMAARKAELAVVFSLVSDSCGGSPTDELFVQADALLNSFEWIAPP